MLTVTVCIIIVAVLLVYIRKTTRQPVQRPFSIEKATVLYVVDGDTIDVLTSNNMRKRVRIIGIDAPESLHPDKTRNTQAGYEASAFARQLCPKYMTVYLEREVENCDKYGRLLRHVWLDDPSLGFENVSFSAIMVKAGHAVPDPHMPNIRHATQLAKLAWPA